MENINSNHEITIENREKIRITEVCDVEGFSDESALIILKKGGLLLKGKNLRMEKLDLDTGIAVFKGEIHSITYNNKKKKGKGFWRRIFE